MRPITELLAFLSQKMTMMTVYQPAIILHLLTREGFSSRADLAQMLIGYEDDNLGFWDKVLMDNPKRWLVGKHQILNYDNMNQTFSLNFDLTDTMDIKRAKTLCEQKIEG
ncbi:MAG: hypothetical protein JO235_00490 [Chroococcidiopsidaceae cyanobacterium CP_BM_RX_35]|nr:hypothetical protein [Chroococcidiopsidaceae cyanobacterium CP_BM_RX_35]